jgi:WhiB family transcriptional regulator, redox-sensing transcriptional regulator
MTTIELPSSTPQSHGSKSDRRFVIPRALMATPLGRLPTQEIAVGIGRFYTVPVAAYGDELPCWSVDPDLFFAESPRDVETAKALCRSCAIRLQCLAGAKERREPWGVWGGELFDNGVVIPTKRSRGRPRKVPIAA